MRTHASSAAIVAGLALVCFACGGSSPIFGEPDAGEPVDSGSNDAGAPDDAGPFDAGTIDAGDDDAGTLDAGPDAGTVDAGEPDAGTDAGTDGGVPLQTRIDAAQATANSNSLCTTLAPFYWELGDKSGALATGQVGTGITGTTQLEIASASKMFFGAYVVQTHASDLSTVDFKAMTMRSGYVSFTDCGDAGTVADCFAKDDNPVYTAADDGLFDYGGGHFEKYAVDLGLGPDDDASLIAEYKNVLGAELDLGFTSPQLAGGMRMNAATYAQFLRKILNSQLALHDHLGENAVCTLPSVCPAAISSPAAPLAWHYSYGHWVEDDPSSGDGSFSSAGAFGFYPWIDSTKTYYGVLARLSSDGRAGMDSAFCGHQIRAAFVSGVQQ